MIMDLPSLQNRLLFSRRVAKRKSRNLPSGLQIRQTVETPKTFKREIRQLSQILPADKKSMGYPEQKQKAHPAIGQILRITRNLARHSIRQPSTVNRQRNPSIPNRQRKPTSRTSPKTINCQK